MSPLTTTLVFTVHIAAGTLGLLAGILAIIGRKGGPLHRLAGSVFFASMLTMAGFAGILALIRPGQIPNLFIAAFTIYLVATAWLTVRRPEGTSGRSEMALLAFVLCLLAPFALLSFDMATGVAPPFKSAVALKGPVMIAIYSFTAVVFLAAFLDARLLLSGGITGAGRIARHLWRMCLGLSLAAGSAFTNGLPRLLPHSIEIPDPYLFAPQFICLGLLVFWMVRVRLWPGPWENARRAY